MLSTSTIVLLCIIFGIPALIVAWVIFGGLCLVWNNIVHWIDFQIFLYRHRFIRNSPNIVPLQQIVIHQPIAHGNAIPSLLELSIQKLIKSNIDIKNHYYFPMIKDQYIKQVNSPMC